MIKPNILNAIPSSSSFHLFFFSLLLFKICIFFSMDAFKIFTLIGFPQFYYNILIYLLVLCVFILFGLVALLDIFLQLLKILTISSSNIISALKFLSHSSIFENSVTYFQYFSPSPISFPYLFYFPYLF